MTQPLISTFAAASLLATATLAGAQPRQIDTAQSKLTVYVYKSGLFSGFADDHIVDAPIAAGTVSDTTPLSVAIEVRAGELKVRDPNLAAGKRDEVQSKMVS